MNDEPTPATKPTNPLGLAGFIVSLVGFCGTGGLLSPIGLIMSLVALKDQPEGFAIAGVVLGALGSCGILITLVFLPFMLLGVLLAVGATGAALTIAAIVGGAELESQVEMAILNEAIEEYRDDQGAHPASMDELRSSMGGDAPAGLFTDHWGNPYIYELTDDGRGYRLFTSGPDGIPGNEDDIEYTGAISFGGHSSNWDFDEAPSDASTEAASDSDADSTGDGAAQADEDGTPQ